MEGVPAEIIDQHNQQVTQAHFAEEQERARITGNPMRGAYVNGQAAPNKRPKINESLEEIEKRAAQFREDRKNGVLPAPVEPVQTAVCIRRSEQRDYRTNAFIDTTSCSDTIRRTTPWRSRGLPTRCASISSPRRPTTLLARQRRHAPAAWQHTRPTRRVTSSTWFRRSTTGCLPARSERRHIQLCRRSDQRGDQGSSAKGREEEQKGQEPTPYLLRRDDKSRGEDGSSAEVCGFHADMMTQWVVCCV